MTIAAKREKLKNYIDTADAKKISSIFNLVEGEIVEMIIPIDVEELNKRRKNHLNGKSKSYSKQEVFDLIEKKRGNVRL